MLGQSYPSARVLVLLALAGLVLDSRGDAGMINRSHQDVDYKRVADDLYKLTPSDELKDNVEAAGKLLEETKPQDDNQGYRMLLVALKTQEYTSDKERLCDAPGLGNLRYLAAKMAAGGNLGPKKISPAIRRLNKIIIQQIISARDVCFKHLAQIWGSWDLPAAYKSIYEMLVRLDKFTRPFLLENNPSLKSRKLSNAPHDSLPCVLFNGEHETKVLKPYVDLLIASNIIESGSKKLAEFYKNDGERIDLAPVQTNKEVEDNAYRFRACELLTVVCAIKG